MNVFGPLLELTVGCGRLVGGRLAEQRGCITSVSRRLAAVLRLRGPAVGLRGADAVFARFVHS